MILSLVFFQCCSDSDKEPELSIDKTSETLDAAATIIKLCITSNCNWTVSCNSNWITPDVLEGNGNKIINIKIAENTSYDIRQGDVVIYNNSLGEDNRCVTLRIEQKPTFAIIVNGNDIVSEWTGGEYEINYEENENATILLDNNANWVHLSESPVTKGLTKHTLKINIDENNGNARECKLLISGIKNTKEINILQEEFIPLESMNLGMDKLNITDVYSHTVYLDFYPSNASDKSFSLEVENNNVVELEKSDGNEIKLRAIKNGTTSIKVSNKRSGISLILPIEVKIKAKSIIPLSPNGNNLYRVYGNYNYKFNNYFKVEPSNAFIDDLIIKSENDEIVYFDKESNAFICGEKDGETSITLSLPYSGIETKFYVNVAECYTKGGYYWCEAGSTPVKVELSGWLRSYNTKDVFKIADICLLNENNQVLGNISNNFIQIYGDGTNEIRFITNEINMTENNGVTNFAELKSALEKYSFLLWYFKGDSYLSKQVKINVKFEYIDIYK